MENTNEILTPAGNPKTEVDRLASELMKWGIMATCFAFTWPVAFLGIVFGSKAKKLEKQFLELEGRTYNCAKVGAVCGKVGFFGGIGMTCFLAIYIIFAVIYVVAVGSFFARHLG